MLLRKEYLLTNFRVQEFVPQSLFLSYGENAIRYMDVRMLAVQARLREYIDSPMTINNWHRGGDRQWCGIRTFSSPYFRVGSAHSWGMGTDSIGDWDAEQVREDIILGRVQLPCPVRLEAGITWLHVDVMNVGNKPVEVFNP